MSDEPRLDIGGRPVGVGEPTYVIAEIGSNHDGDLELALDLVRRCAAAGVDAVKFQAFTREGLFVPDLPDDGTDQRRHDRELLHRRWDVLPRFTVPDAWWEPLRDACADVGVDFLATPFSLDALDRLVGLGMPAVKIASGDVTWHELIRAAAATGLPVVMSTGASTLDEVDEAVAAAAAAHDRLALLHCVSNYPPDWDDVHLRAISDLRERYGVPVGLSDHAPGATLPVAAVALGSCVLEKHVTVDRARDGLDHHFALLPDELAEVVSQLRLVERSMGTGKRPAVGEEIERFWVRRGIWTRRALRAGEVLRREDVDLVRPQAAAPASAVDVLVGRALRHDVPAGAALDADDLS